MLLLLLSGGTVSKISLVHHLLEAGSLTGGTKREGWTEASPRSSASNCRAALRVLVSDASSEETVA
ncbi:hypothetical protein BDA99DRAFT_512947 [Phascolomyces articulosus]|uniref:Uncharacterized protein n=1 Tax=Phascolomyces articulosus TaxID=60185 RepID=A0AAD5KBU8_9FUNG|nr:hypothetical protein BDA99DRAFT_512947 [Phascolomyces articulosus]